MSDIRKVPSSILGAHTTLIPTSLEVRRRERYTKDMRDTYIIGGLAVVVIATGIFLILQGGNGGQVASPSAATDALPIAATVPFTELVRGMQSEVKTRVNYLITSTEGLEKLWEMVDATGTPPVVDFKKDSVIAVFAGEKPTTGHAIEVAKVEDAIARTVSITLTNPGGSCVVGQAITAPYQVIVVPLTTLSFAHEDISTTTGCLN